LEEQNKRERNYTTETVELWLNKDSVSVSVVLNLASGTPFLCEDATRLGLVLVSRDSENKVVLFCSSESRPTFLSTSLLAPFRSSGFDLVRKLHK
jgi:hypothetical protein